MLTGRTPFEGANPFAVMNARLFEDPEPMREQNPEIAPALESIVLRALKRDPEQRYASAREFSFDLSHPSQVRMLEPAPRKNGRMKRVLLYSGLAAIPASVFGLMLYVAGHS
jgi:serine/threonine-protein kinase